MTLRKSLIYGAIAGAVFAIFSFLNIGFVLGTPTTLSLETVGRFMVVVILAPIMEEIVFRFILLGYLNNSVKLSFAVSAIIQAGIFSLFHISAYGTTGKSALFVSAFIFGIAMAYLLKNTNTSRWYFNITPAIVAHAIVNFALTAGTYVIAPSLNIGG